jgi:protein-L-isoaspartate(D-aspartate) O-methyltransferase
VDEALASRSYENISLPIGHGQTISQPYIVARMSQLLVEAQTEKLNKVLEIGTGSGYQAAVLSSLVGEIHSVERIYALYQATNTLLHALNYKNIHTHLATNEVGLNRYAPYDGIIVTAAPEEVPQALLQQLKMGGRLVIPLGKQGEDQMLKVITRVEPEKFVTENHETVQFVPFIQDLH